jgi:hypothetical protein
MRSYRSTKPPVRCSHVGPALGPQPAVNEGIRACVVTPFLTCPIANSQPRTQVTVVVPAGAMMLISKSGVGGVGPCARPTIQPVPINAVATTSRRANRPMVPPPGDDDTAFWTQTSPKDDRSRQVVAGTAGRAGLDRYGRQRRSWQVRRQSRLVGTVQSVAADVSRVAADSGAARARQFENRCGRWRPRVGVPTRLDRGQVLERRFSRAAEGRP